ncbi:protein PLANT CADMIUM RESISTANCE 4-like [Pistacia vera]|uniref:protein PLANT CADMIUM RESISTANCE 4-like n=1 Tax=Pistacia vera TaxID=55513 RepID=UPI001262B9CE|nr:protein PLANT CADMIUM RESISTANCE 4-like [Pistacia vera]
MGNPEAGSSDYQPQSEYELQPQDYQYEATHEAMASQDPQAQQQFQPPQSYPPPLQPNQAAYGAQPGRPINFPPQNSQMNSPGLNQPGMHPQQGPPLDPVKPMQFPPSDPQNNQTYGQNQPGAYAPYNQKPMPAPQSPMNFPPIGPQASTGMQFPPNNGPQTPYGVPVTGQGKLGNGWHSELFDCMNDPMNALVTVLFPCLTFGQIAEIIDDGHTSCGTSGMLYGGIAFCIALPCIMSCTYRTKLRNKFGLPEAPAPDWVTHFLCEWCALCQEYRELQARGWDPSIGYQGNLARHSNMNMNHVNMMPPGNQRMMG